MTTVAKLALSVGAIGFALTGATVSAQTNVISDPVGFYKVPLVVGPNAVSAPLHPIQSYRGSVASATANSVTLSGTPNFATDQFGPVSGRSQFIVVVRKDIAPAGGTNDITGDWWEVLSNTAGTITVDPGFDDLSTALQAGDQLEVRKLTSLADLFGPPNASILNGQPGNTDSGAGDAIKILSGTSFARTIVLNTNTFQYRAGVQNYTNGTSYTFLPNEAFIVVRIGAPTNMTVLGQVQTTPLTQYFVSGPNAFANQFPANQALIDSGIKEMILASSAASLDNNTFTEGTEDGIRTLIGTSFGASIVLNSTGDFRSGIPNQNALPLVPGSAYIYYVKPGTGGRVYRQPVPFVP